MRFLSSIHVFILVLICQVFGCLEGISPAFADAAFEALTPIGSAPDVAQIHLADIDHDGVLDLVTVGDDGVQWLAQDGSWTRTAIDGAWAAGTSLAVADLDLDGALDVVASSSSSGIAWWRNSSGDGSTWVETTVNASESVLALQLIDLDLDGDLDVVAALGGAGGSIEWWRNDGDAASWTRLVIAATLADAAAVAIADLDADGDPDVVAGAGGSTDTLNWYDNDGNAGTWTARVIDGAADVVDLSITDLDGDGDFDIAAATTDALRIYDNDGSPSDGGFSVESIVGSDPEAVRIGDLDGDGDPDIATVTDDRLVWLENTDSGYVTRLAGAQDDVSALTLGDLDADGDADQIGGGHTFDQLIVWSNQTLHRNASFVRENTLNPSFDGGRAVHAADLDGDGDLDLAAASFDAGTIEVWENTHGDGSQWTLVPVDSSLPWAFSVRATDLDADGDQDLVATGGRLNAMNITDLVVWYENVSSGGVLAFSRATLASSVRGAADVWPADIDADGDVDLFIAGAVEDQVLWLRQGVSGTFTECEIDDQFDRVYSLVGGDLDNDGDLDVVATGDTADQVAWWENDGAVCGSWTKHVILDNWDGAFDVWAADLDSDGDLDVIAASQFEDQILWFANQGDGTFISQPSLGFFNQAYSVTAGDLDGDGDVDVAGAAFKDGGKLAVWSNADGVGGSWIKTEVTGAYDGANAVHLADLNGDGQLDLMSTAQVDDQLTWWPNGGGQFALATTSQAPPSLSAGAEPLLFEIVLDPRGLASEANVELAAIELLFEESPGDPLTSFQSTGLLDFLSLYADDGAMVGSFDASDSVIASIMTPVADGAGMVEIEVADGTPLATVAQMSNATFWISAEITNDLADQPITGLRISHATERTAGAAASRGEDAQRDIPLRLEWSENVATPTYDVNDVANLSVNLEASVSPAPSGGSLDYTVTLMNDGPDAATDVIVTMTLGSNLSLDSTSGCAEDPAGISTCSLGDIPASGSQIVTVSTLVDVEASGTADLMASVMSSTPDDDPTQDSALLAVPIDDEFSDLAVSKSGPTTYGDGWPIRWRILVDNLGNTAANATITDLVPAQVTNATWTCSATGGAVCGSASGSGDINDMASLPPGSRLSYIMEADVPNGEMTTISNSASAAVTSGASDNTPGNDGATVVSPWADALFLDGFESGTASSWSVLVSN